MSTLIIENNNLSKRNYSLDIMKLIAAFMVVLIHFPFPGIIGDITDTIGRFAVPFFFLSSGFFYYNSYIENNKNKTKKNIKHILKLALISCAIYLMWKCILLHNVDDIINYFISLCKFDNLLAFAVFNSPHPISEHLWFLFALIYTYISIYLCSKKGFRVETLLRISIILLGINLFVTEILPIFDISFFAKNVCYIRNWLMFGIPFFSIGMYIRLCQQKNINLEIKTNKYVFSIFIGIAISILEKFIFGNCELYIGSIVTSISLFLLSLNMEHIKIKDKYAKYIEKSSLLIYIMHPLIGAILSFILKHLGLVKNIFVIWATPLLICLASLIFSIFYIYFLKAITKNNLMNKQ